MQRILRLVIGIDVARYPTPRLVDLRISFLGLLHPSSTEVRRHPHLPPPWTAGVHQYTTD